MKTMAELQRWLADAAAQGDPSARICHLYFRFANLVSGEGDDLIAYLGLNRSPAILVLRLGPSSQLPLPLRMGERKAEETESFEAVRVAAGLWSLRPAVLVPGTIHAFVTLYGVPEPAPWERPQVAVEAI